MMKNEISHFCEDWLIEFPLLKRYKNGRKLIRRSGVVVFGVELRKIFNDWYRPELICLNLLSCWNEFSLSREFSMSQERLYQCDIKHAKHDQLYRKVADFIRMEIPVLSKQAPSIGDIVQLYMDHVSYERERGENATVLMLSTIQIARFYEMKELESRQTEDLWEYFNGFKPSVREYCRDMLLTGLSFDREGLVENMNKNLDKAGWPEDSSIVQ